MSAQPSSAAPLITVEPKSSAPSTERNRDTLTIEEAAVRLGIGRSAAYEAARRGQLPTIRMGRRILVPRHQLDRLLGVPE